MPLKGICWLPVVIGGMSTWSKFYIDPNLDRAMMLLEDWLKKNQAQISFQPNLLIIKGVKIPLDRGAFRAISVYSEEDVKQPDRTAIVFSARLDSPGAPGGILYQVIPRNKPLLENEVIVVETTEEDNSQGFQEPLAGNIQEDDEIQWVEETIKSGNAPKTWTDRYLVQNGLKPRRKYMGEDHHKLILDRRHKISAQAGRKIERAQKKRNKMVNQNRKKVELGIGEPVYNTAHTSQNKRHMRWRPYYRIVGKTGPVSFVIWDQISGTTKRVHAKDLKLVEIEKGKAPKI